MAKYYVKSGGFHKIISTIKTPFFACQICMAHAAQTNDVEALERVDVNLNGAKGAEAFFYVDERGFRGPDETLAYSEETGVVVVDTETMPQYTFCSPHLYAVLQHCIRGFK